MSDARESVLSIDEPQEEDEPEVVSVMNTREMIIYYVGKNTGRTYIFNGAGSIVENVDKLDAEEMANLPLIPSCCGSLPSVPYFQIVGR